MVAPVGEGRSAPRINDRRWGGYLGIPSAVGLELTIQPGGLISGEHYKEWLIKADAISHLQLRIKPDKGGKAGRATLTTLALE